jgi:hypothetical protein
MSISVAGCNKRSISEVQNDSEMNNGAVTPIEESDETEENVSTVADNISSTPSLNTDISEAEGYKEKLTEDEINMVLELATKFYEEFPYEMISLKVADNDYSGYSYYKEYKPGNIIIFLAETKHAGEGIYRSIVYVRKDVNSEWEQINEGY